MAPMDGETMWSPPVDPTVITEALFSWFDEHHRPFPWRSVDDPWQLLVLEVMSQQTQLERVTAPWEAFVERWPTPHSLAAASSGEVIAFWSEHRLGYNRRAAYLHEAAAMVLEAFDGELPSSPSALQRLPGVGPYTANAVASFAYNTGDPVIDTNVKRVLFRAFEVTDEDTAYESAAAELAEDADIGRWNGAIMELGGVACGSTPRCDEVACPLRRWCRAYHTGDFTAPDVPEQPAFEGSRRQHRGRVLSVLRAASPRSVDELGKHLDESYDSTDPAARGWLDGLLEGMVADQLIEVDDEDVSFPD